MKVLMITHGFAPECSGGTESYVLGLTRELIESGHRVEVLTGSHEGAGPGIWEPRLEHDEFEGIPVHRLHRTGLWVDNWEKSLAPEVEPLLQYILRDFAPDIVHVQHWIRLSRNLVEICHEAGIPTVCTLHDLWTTCPKAFRIRENTHCELECGPTNCQGCALPGENMSEEEERRELSMFRDDFRNELDLTRRIIVPSCAHRDVLLRQMPSLRGKFRVVPHGNISKIRAQRPWASNFPQAKLRIGHWGHLSSLKGIDLLFEALQASEYKDRISLELFGEIVYPQERERIKALAEGLDINWHGRYVPDDLTDVPIDLAVIPSRCSESWSFVLDEAFLLGLPVICSDRGALGERVEGAGTTFSPDDADDLRRAIDTVFETPEILEEWADNVPQLPAMRRHTLSVDRVYQEVLSSRAPLPQTPLSLRKKRLSARSYQLELRNREMEERMGQIRNLENDVRKQRETLEEMGGFHREKDKEIERLSLSLAELGGEESVSALHSELSEARSRIKELEKKDRKKQRRVDRLRSELVDQEQAKLQEEETDRRRGKMRALEALNAGLALRERELRVQLETRLEEVGGLEADYSELTTAQHLVRDAVATEAKMKAALEIERAAVQHLTASLQAQQERLKVLASHGSALGHQMKQLGVDVTEIMGEASEAIGDGAVSEPLGEGAAPDFPQLAGADPDASLLSEITSAESQAVAVLDHAIQRQAWLHSVVSNRQRLVGEMAKTIDGLLDMIEGIVRKRARAEATPREPQAGDRLSILMVVHQFLPRHVAGTEVYTHGLAKELAKQHDLLVLTAESNHDKPRFAEERIQVDGIPVHRVIHNYEWSSFRDTYDCPRADTIFRRLLRENRPDVVHLQHLHYFSLNFATIARSLGIPVVYTLHDYGLMCPRDGTLRREDGELCREPVPSKCRDCIAHHHLGEDHAPVLPRALKPGIDVMVPDEVARVVRQSRLDTGNVEEADPFAEAISERLDYVKRVMADVDLFISPSHFLRDRFVEAGMIDADRIIVSDNGYEQSRLPSLDEPPKRDSSKLRVGFVGTIAEHKGVHVLIDAMNGIEDERVSCRIWGDMTAFWHYTEQLRGMTVNPRTFLMGPFDNDRVADVFSQLDLLVVPSLWYENSPLTLHEAAACGVPVLASDQGGMSEYVKPEVTGRLFKMGDVAALREGIISFLERPITAFAPDQLEIKPIERDAHDTEQRYRKLISRNRALR